MWDCEVNQFFLGFLDRIFRNYRTNYYENFHFTGYDSQFDLIGVLYTQNIMGLVAF